MSALFRVTTKLSGISLKAPPKVKTLSGFAGVLRQPNQFTKNHATIINSETIKLHFFGCGPQLGRSVGAGNRGKCTHEIIIEAVQASFIGLTGINEGRTIELFHSVQKLATSQNDIKLSEFYVIDAFELDVRDVVIVWRQ